MVVEIGGDALTTVKRPSALDAGGHRRFRARADQQPVRRTTGAPPPRGFDEGFTVDLFRFAGSRPTRRLNGVREYVSPPVPLPARGYVSWMGLGFTLRNAEPDPEETRNAEFLKRLLRGRNLAAIRKRIEVI
jgi:hypothetical protein